MFAGEFLFDCGSVLHLGFLIHSPDVAEVKQVALTICRCKRGNKYNTRFFIFEITSLE